MHSLYFDGASRGNPGPAGAGGVIYDAQQKIVDTYAINLGVTTNNVAEYGGLLAGLNRCHKLNIKELQVYGDSKLIINQVNGKWKVRNEKLKSIYEQVKKVQPFFTTISFEHVYRKDNKEADKMANVGVDGHY